MSRCVTRAQAAAREAEPRSALTIDWASRVIENAAIAATSTPGMLSEAPATVTLAHSAHAEIISLPTAEADEQFGQGVFMAISLIGLGPV